MEVKLHEAFPMVPVFRIKEIVESHGKIKVKPKVDTNDFFSLWGDELESEVDLMKHFTTESAELRSSGREREAKLLDKMVEEFLTKETILTSDKQGRRTLIGMKKRLDCLKLVLFLRHSEEEQLAGPEHRVLDKKFLGDNRTDLDYPTFTGADFELPKPVNEEELLKVNSEGSFFFFQNPKEEMKPLKTEKKELESAFSLNLALPPLDKNHMSNFIHSSLQSTT